MELISWHPDPSRECGEGELSLSLKLSVECSVCRMIYKLASDRYVVRADVPWLAIRENLDRIVDEAITPRPCPDCGVVQTFSRHDRGRVREEMQALITEEWLRAQCRKLAA